ncbi:TPA: phage tail tape measure protein [Vibrio parahaemolyticus]|nr:phage tail tape measure protein [Vibrio parahaemolyticus]HCG7758313.1 phage tail tape measure protein [Vibrio parahaemolyticus]HCM1217633.1 phage tail tape measure protein [Vibrio parahaemolyticus]
MNSVDKLMMQIGLQDYATKPLKGIQKTVTQTADVSRQSWEQMAGGAASMLGSGFAIKQALMPAIEMDRVLGEVKSLGVIDADLKTLQQTALDFSSTYGKSATELVGAAYDIKSAMGDMSGADLAGVTESSAILAAATKADTATITSYMGTMYSVFQSQADAIGKDNWAERVAGMTAKSVEKFKTTGQGMSDAFKGIGSLAKTHGIEMQNQMAILGMLQGSMSGSEAGTKYKAFLTGAVNAQEKLGLSFTDTNGKLLPMYDILESIKGKFGDLDSTEISQLKSAFGSDEAIMVVTDLIGKTQSLKANITDLGGAANLDFAKNMAGAMTDQWERLEASWYAIRAGAFGLILPAINSVAGAMADGLTTLLAYTQQYPTLTSYAGYLALAVAGGAGIMGAYNLTMGASRLAMNALKAPLLFTKVSILSLGGAYTKAKWSLWALNYSMLKQGIYSKNASLANKAYAVSTYLVDKAMLAASGGLKAFGVAALKSAVMMLANPIFWIPAAIAAVGAAALVLISNWDALVATLGDWWVFEQIGKGFDFIVGLWDSAVDSIISHPFVQRLVSDFTWMWDRASGVFQGIALAGQGAWNIIGAGISLLISPFTAAWTLAKSFFTLLKDGPAAAMDVLGTIPEQFTAIWQSATTGFGMVYDGISLYITSLLDVFKSPFALVGDGIDWLIDKINLIPGVNIRSDVEQPTMPEMAGSKVNYQLGNYSQQATNYSYVTQSHVEKPVLPELGQPNAIEYQSQVEQLKTLPSYQSAVQYQAFTEQPNVTTLDSSVNYQTHLPNAVLPELGQPNAIEYQSQVELPSVSPLDSRIDYQAQLQNTALPELGRPNAIEYQSQVEPLKTLPGYQSAVHYQALTEQPSVSPLDSSIRYQAQLLEVAQPSPVEYQSQLQTLNGLPQYHSLAQYKAEFAGVKVPELGGVVNYAANMPSMASEVIDMNARRQNVTRPISEYLNGGETQSVANYITAAGSNGYTDNSKNMHTGDIVITQEKPFTPSQLAEWQEMATP